MFYPKRTSRAVSFRVCVFAANTASGTSNTLYTSFYRYKSASSRANRVYNSNSCASVRGIESDQHQRQHYSAVGARSRQRMYSAALPQRETEQRQGSLRDRFVVVAAMSKPSRGLDVTRSTFVDLVLLRIPCVAARRRESFAFHRHQ